MKIGIDARSLGAKICGVSRVTLALIHALASIDHKNEYIIYTDQLESIPCLPANFRVVQSFTNRMNALHDYELYSLFKNADLDVLHVMHSWLPLLIPAGIRSIVTIHDIFSVTDRDFFIKRRPFHWLFRLYFKFLTKITIDRADVIITVSRYCEEEIKRVFNPHKKQIQVVYNSPGIIPDERLVSPRLIQQNYFFYLGNFRGYKNVPTLINGYGRFLQRSGSKMDLVVAGNDAHTGMLILVKKLGIENRVHFITRPSDQIIDNLYRNASVFVFPSKFEGFGIPPLEAMSYGVPVVISDAAALIETANGAALIFDRNSPDDLADKLIKITEDNDLRADLVSLGRANAARYTWGNSAYQLLQIYNSLAKPERGTE